MREGREDFPSAPGERQSQFLVFHGSLPQRRLNRARASVAAALRSRRAWRDARFAMTGVRARGKIAALKNGVWGFF
jgi:hypothetical protein